ncbi:MAG: rhomboid family intramembrane serine protease, partial [Gammaproteobacteria bacterium]
ALYFALWPLQPIYGESLFHPWQLITQAFLHGGVPHLAFNMLGLWMFGHEIEQTQGPRRFLTLYFSSVITAAIAQLFVPSWLGLPLAPTIGASGGVFGLLLAFAVFFPKRKVIPLIPPIPMPAWLFATSYAAIELYLGVTGTQGGVAHFAHLGGMVGGGIVLYRWYQPGGRR